MANINSILPTSTMKERRGGYSKENAQEIFGASEITVRVASDVNNAYVWSDEKRQYTEEVSYQYVYIELPGGDPFKLKLAADADLSNIRFADTVQTLGLEACNSYDYKTHHRETYFRAHNLKKEK